MNFVAPEYPREARLKHIQGEAKLDMVVSPSQHNIVTDLHAVSGDPLLVAAAMKAASQWTFQMTYGGFSGPGPAPDLEIPLTFTFVIEDPPKPAWIHLTNGSAIRADEVREYEDGFEYTSNGRSHRIAPERVSAIDGCRRTALIHLIVKPEDGDCNGVIGGGPYFTIRAFPLLPASGKSVGNQDAPQPAANSGILCIITLPQDGKTSYFANVPFDPATLMFRIDGGEKIPWPQKPGYKVEGLDLEKRHLVALYSKGKIFQSFRFTFKDRQATDLCLLFDGTAAPISAPSTASAAASRTTSDGEPGILKARRVLYRTSVRTLSASPGTPSLRVMAFSHDIKPARSAAPLSRASSLHLRARARL